MAKAMKPDTERDWQIKSAADTLLRAEEIKADKPLYDAAMRELKKRKAALAVVLQNPLPSPKKGEERKAFIKRCAGSKAMNAEFPDNAQRVGVCFSQWRKVHGGKKPK